MREEVELGWAEFGKERLGENACKEGAEGLRDEGEEDRWLRCVGGVPVVSLLARCTIQYLLV